jgi:hypothetical protein
MFSLIVQWLALQSSLMYHPWAQQLAVLSAEIPWLALSLALGPSISYFMIGLGSSGGAYVFFVNFLTLFELSLTCVLLGSTISNAMPTFEVAQAAIGAVTPILMLYAGLYSKGEHRNKEHRRFTITSHISLRFSSLPCSLCNASWKRMDTHNRPNRLCVQCVPSPSSKLLRGQLPYDSFS